MCSFCIISSCLIKALTQTANISILPTVVLLSLRAHHYKTILACKVTYPLFIMDAIEAMVLSCSLLNSKKFLSQANVTQTSIVLNLANTLVSPYPDFLL